MEEIIIKRNTIGRIELSDADLISCDVLHVVLVDEKYCTLARYKIHKPNRRIINYVAKSSKIKFDVATSMDDECTSYVV